MKGPPPPQLSQKQAVNEERLTERLASRILGWKLAPGRFVKPNRGWTPRWQFAPFRKVEDVLLLLDRMAATYALTVADGSCTAEVRLANRSGGASDVSLARALTLALVTALGLEVPR
jgi:hypothetical protein